MVALKEQLINLRKLKMFAPMSKNSFFTALNMLLNNNE